jgi:tRNA(Leu) C34 or U34 (ribose-2'-O)-methylase TrmL
MSITTRGFFGIGVYHPKTEENVGTLWRHAYLYGADFIYTIGRRYRKQSSDTPKTYRHLPLYHYESYEDFLEHLPFGSRLVCVELNEQAQLLPNASHPQQAVYLLGAEDHGIPDSILAGHQVLQIPCLRGESMNVSVSGTLVMYDRFLKHGKANQ